MLRKLLKHEFRATGRIMLPLFGILLLVSVGANFSSRGMLNLTVPSCARWVPSSSCCSSWGSSPWESSLLC